MDYVCGMAAALPLKGKQLVQLAVPSPPWNKFTPLDAAEKQ